MLEQLPWPGNVRQLRHAVERVVALHSGGPVSPVHLDHLVPEEQPAAAAETVLAYEEERARFERDCLQRLLAAADEMTVTAVKAAAAPKLDGVANDEVWKTAPALEVRFGKGANFGGSGESTGTLKAAYLGDMLYLVLQYKDSTHSQQRSPYVKQPDGTWKKLKDPDDKGGDDNKFYEDKAAFILPINNSIPRFAKEGCFTSCHDDEPSKPFGNKYTEVEGQLADMWHLKTVRTGPVGQVDDGYLDHTRFDPEKEKNAGRKTDPKTGGGYTDIALKDGKPEFMSKDGKAANKGGTYWLKAEDRAPFDDSKFQPGDEVASITIAPFEGDRGRGDGHRLKGR